MNRSVPTKTHLEFLNIVPLNSMVSKCEIKVLYSGLNRNNSFISKEVANKIANSLPGVPIVGEYLEEEKDYGNHGDEAIKIDADGVRFIKSTSPYGFVPTDTKVWWSTFLDGDGVEREYLLCEGYLWTGRYPEAKRIIENGNHQSMELDRETLYGTWETLDGEWTNNINESEEYFIIKEATFSALCILGQNVEPCFEGANITRDSNLVYSLNQNEFKKEMSEFILDLKEALNAFELDKGGNKMTVENLNAETAESEELIIDASKDEETLFAKEEEQKDDVKSEKDNKEEKDYVDNSSEEEDSFAKDKDDEEEEDSDKDDSFAKEDEDKDKKDESYAKEEEKDKDKEDEYEASEKEDEEKDKEGYEVLLDSFESLKQDYAKLEGSVADLESEVAGLREFKMSADNIKKDELINSFYMLADEDKQEVIENKANFSLEEIESKLSVICVRKKVNFNLEEDSKNDNKVEDTITTFDVSKKIASSSPAWLKAVDSLVKSKK